MHSLHLSPAHLHQHLLVEQLQACRTLLNIANAREEQGMPYSDLEPLYRQALALAEKADHPRLQATTLNSLAVLQETSGYLEDSSRSAVVELSHQLQTLSFSHRKRHGTGEQHLS